MLALEEAVAKLLDGVRPLGTETVPLADAVGRFLAETVASPIDLPPFDNSAMDGYAVRADDTQPAAEANPVVLRLVGSVPAGGSFAGQLAPGECVRVFTGSPLPAGADAVVMQEDVRVIEDKPEAVELREPVKPWESVRFRGEDIRRGAVLVEAGGRLRLGQLALLAGTGIASVKVGRRPVVAVLPTGDELRAPGEPLRSGEIYESNSLVLTELVRRAGGLPVLAPPLRDDPAVVETALTRAFREADVVLTAGGASVGEHDLIKPVFTRLGGELEFWRVAMKPGKPFFFGRWQGRLLCGVPGNPVSAFVTTLLLVTPLLMRLQGGAANGLPTITGELAEPLNNPDRRRHFVRVTLDADGRVGPAGLQASHRLRSLADADGVVDVPPQTNLPAGAKVRVLRWE